MKRLGVLALLLAGCIESEEAVVRARLLTDSVKSVLDAPDLVKVLRLNLGPYPKGAKKPETWPEVPATAEMVADDATARELAGLLRDERSYPVIGKGCRPSPGVKVQFKRGPTTIEAYLCFECRMLAFFGPGASGERGWTDFEPIASKLSAIVKKAFHDDEGVQSIKY